MAHIYLVYTYIYIKTQIKKLDICHFIIVGRLIEAKKTAAVPNTIVIISEEPEDKIAPTRVFALLRSIAEPTTVRMRVPWLFLPDLNRLFQFYMTIKTDSWVILLDYKHSMFQVN